MSKTLRTTIVLAIILLISGLNSAFGDTINPDLADALKAANASGKLLLVDFYGDWCPWCVKMDDTFNDSAIKAMVGQSFYYQKIDIGNMDQHQSCISQYKINGIPLLIVFNSDGSIRTKSDGYMDAKDLKSFLLQATASYSPPVPLHKDLEDALKMANDAGKQLLVYFYGDWSDDCDKMDEIIGDKYVREALLKHYYIYKMDIGHFDEHKGCIFRYKIDSVPTFVTFNHDGTSKSTLSKVVTAAGFKAFLKSSETFIPITHGIMPDLEDALKTANQSGRQLLVDFYGDWCPWCVKMDEIVADSDVQEAIDKHFYYYKLDVGHFDKHTDCLSQYDVESLPQIVAFTPDGSVSSTCKGYKDAESFKMFLAMAEVPVSVPEGIHPDLADALQSAKKAGKTLLVEFSGDWCQTSTDMDQTLADAGVRAAIDQKFYLYKLDVGRFERFKSCTDRYKVTGVPHMMAFNDDGSVRTEYRGFMDPDRCKVFLDKIASNSRGFTNYDLATVSHGPDAVQTAVKNAGYDGLLLAVYFCEKGTPADDAMEALLAKADISEAASHFALLKVEVPFHKELSAKYGCKKAPLLVLFKKDGKPSATLFGAVTADKIVSEMEKLSK